MNPALPVEALRTIAAREANAIHGVRLVVLFGSIARGSARPNSDADLAVLGGGFWQQLALGSAVAGELGREPHVVDLYHASDTLAYEVARTASRCSKASRMPGRDFKPPLPRGTTIFSPPANVAPPACAAACCGKQR